MARRQSEIQVIMHWPKSELGWRILIGRIVIFNELMDAKNRAETLNMDYCIRKITQEDALDAYEQALKETQYPKKYRRNNKQSRRNLYY